MEVDSKLKILVAEDNPVNRRLIEVILGKIGLTADEAFNGEMAIKIATEKKYDVIFMDLHMPLKSGFEAARAILDVHPETTIAVVSADVYPETVQQCLDCGVKNFIRKPFNKQDILDVIAEASGRIGGEES